MIQLLKYQVQYKLTHIRQAIISRDKPMSVEKSQVEVSGRWGEECADIPNKFNEGRSTQSSLTLVFTAHLINQICSRRSQLSLKHYSQESLTTQLRKSGNSIKVIVDNPTPTKSDLEKLHRLLREQNSLKSQLKSMRKEDYKKYNFIHNDEDWHKAETKKRQNKQLRQNSSTGVSEARYRKYAKDVCNYYSFEHIYKVGLELVQEVLKPDNPDLTYRGENWLIEQYAGLDRDNQVELGGYAILLDSLIESRNKHHDNFDDVKVVMVQEEINQLRTYCDRRIVQLI